MESGGHFLACLLDSHPCATSGAVSGRGIAVQVAQPWLHGLEHLGVELRGGGIIQIDHVQ